MNKHTQSLPFCLVLVLALAACSAPATPTVPARPALRVAQNIGLDFEDLPFVMALERLKEQGYTYELTEYADPGLAVEAMAQGGADLSFGASRTYWAAIQKGAPLVTLMEQIKNDYAILAVAGIETCADLDGKRIAVSNKGSLTHAMLSAYLQSACPGAQPEMIVITDSSARAAALLAGEVDASPLILADVLDLTLQEPGRFHVLADLSEQLPHLVTKGVYTTRSFAAQHPGVVRDLIRALLQVHRAIAADHNLLAAEAEQRLATNPATLPAIVETYFAANMWDVNGGLTPEAVQYSLDFFIASGSLDPGLTAEQVADLSFLNDVLDEIGRE